MPKKKLETKLNELEDSIKLLSDAISFVNSGKQEYFNVISAQLRALLFCHNRSYEPLFLNLAKHCNKTFYCYGPLNPTPKNLPTPVFSHPGPSSPLITLSPPDSDYPFLEKNTLQEWLEKEIMIISEHSYSPRKIIAVAADRLGGAHYSEKLSPSDENIINVTYSSSNGSFSQVQVLLLQTADVMLRLSQELLRTLTQENK